MNICVTVNSKYIRYLYVMLVSLLENNRHDLIKLFVVHQDLTENDIKIVNELIKKYNQTVEYICPDNAIFEKISDNVLREILFRVMLHNYLPVDIDRILLLDVDIVVNSDILELYNTDFEGCCFAAAQDMFAKGVVWKDNRKWYPADRKNWIHFNTGVLLYNLTKLRMDYPGDSLLRKGIEIGLNIPTYEEELINIVFGEDDIKQISFQKWNYMPGLHDYDLREDYVIYKDNRELIRNAHIMHFAQQNPWDKGRKNEAFKIWWKYASCSPFYVELLEESYWKAEEYIYELPDILSSTENKLRYIDDLMDDKVRERLYKSLHNRKVARVIVYGAGRIGRFISLALEDTDFTVECFVDKEKRGLFCGVETIGTEQLKDFAADIIIISNVAYAKDVRVSLTPKTDIPIVTIDDLI